MIDANTSANPGDRVEAVLRQDLASGDVMLGTVAPILRHLLANDDHSIFGDEIIARVRGMTSDVARQLTAELLAIDKGDIPEAGLQQADILAMAIIANPAFLCHVHALALEWQLTERMQARLALDPVLPPLLQALVSSGEPVTSGTAMKLLAAQARFCQSQRRMQLPLSELPGDLLHGCLITMRTMAGVDGVSEDGRAAAAESAIRAHHDEGQSRIGLISRLVTGMGGGAVAALSVTHAGAAMFLSALALASGQDRDLMALATNEGQLARFALSLRAAGLKPQAIEEQFLAFHPEIALPDDFDRLSADRAAAILAVSGGYTGL